MMAGFAGNDSYFGFTLRDTSKRLQMQIPHNSSRINSRTSVSLCVHDLMMQIHTAGQETAEQPMEPIAPLKRGTITSIITSVIPT